VINEKLQPTSESYSEMRNIYFITFYEVCDESLLILKTFEFAQGGVFCGHSVDLPVYLGYTHV